MPILRFRRSIGVALLAAGCGPNAHEVQLRQLAETVKTLQAQAARQNDRTAKLSNRLILLSDHLDGAQNPHPHHAESPPDLEIVRLVPEKPRHEGRDMIDERSDRSQPSPELEAKPIEITLTGTPEPRKRAVGPRADADPAQLFRRALEAYRSGQGAVAYSRFAEFARVFPDHDYADNARYWMGECRFERAQYREALAEFQRVLSDYPRSKKAPDALLKIGLSYERLGMHKRARRAFERVIATFPETALAELARSRLASVTGAQGAVP